ncbi:hypothetical protein [Aquisalinus flavus]|uniref:TNase-like domain-containing protein n=1 Tax=Aquisalinus flavus TaxID=1526572 RepID=A0A8J2V4D3_9PROT|nr:hypothetical protein [Aquisalinus flavus]MBD0426583.1 hypothetical protein [Aquisalinus flavus]UNE47870.1 hypothetical protein FF099_07305 [Aquisalinus flavus]GGD06791.1 hypothetical protein GCM10011342_14520 [Aquisalinus flavus]
MIGAALSLALGAALQAGADSASDGRCFEYEAAAYCLAGVAAPSRVDLDPAESAIADAAAAALQAALEAAIAAGDLFLEPVGAPDRWGRMPVLAFAEDTTEPLQVRLIEQGHLSILPDQLPAAFDDRFRAAQLTAQVTGRGVWATESLRVLYADDAGEGEGQLRFVRGRVRYAYEGRDWTYLNFGRDYRTDFTIMIKPRLAQKMTEAGQPPSSFEGRRIEVYGLIHQENGPAVELTSGANIRIIPD